MFFSKPSLIFFVVICTTTIANCQSNIPTGTWRTHYSFNSTLSVSQNNQYIYAASASGVYILDKKDQSITSITKLNGLTDTDISVIHFNKTSHTLLISYSNGQINLLVNNKMNSIPDIKLSKKIQSKICHHMFDDGIFTYLSTDFGLIKIDTKAQIIQEAYLNLSNTGDNLKIYASLIFNDSLFLATENGLMAADLNENLKDFTKWKRYNSLNGVTNEPTTVLGMYQNKPIAANTSQGVLLYNNELWMPFGNLIGKKFTSIHTNQSTIISASGSIYKVEQAGISQIKSPYIINGIDVISDKNSYWVADTKNGLIHVVSSNSENFYPNGPFFNDIVRLKSVQNKIIAFPTFKKNNGSPLRNNAGFSVFENGFWTNYNTTGYPQTKPIPTFLDITGASSQKTGEIILSSYGYGLLTWKDELFKIMDDTNSPLVNSLPPNKNVLITDIDGKNGDLWILNNNTPSSLHFLSKKNQWSTYSPSNATASATQIIATTWGDQWMVIKASAGGGIIVRNQSGNEISLKTGSLGAIPSNTINQLLLDQENKIWVATKKGVVFYPSPSSIFNNSSPKAIIPIINHNLLFSNENVNCLTIEGGNRIWMGTNKGAWLFDNDGSVLVKHFTTKNSPLLSDVVKSIAINKLSGEIFFSTDKGLVSYRGTTSITETYKEPKIFPNPVNPEFNGLITIEGVPSNSIIKITDSSGRLVETIQADGNKGVWDMQNAYANKISTGVYFVFISNPDGSSTQFGKIAIIK